MAAPQISLDSVTPQAGGQADSAFVEANIVESPVDILNADGTVADKADSGQGRYVFALVWGEGQWKVNGVAAG